VSVWFGVWLRGLGVGGLRLVRVAFLAPFVVYFSVSFLEG